MSRSLEWEKYRVLGELTDPLSGGYIQPKEQHRYAQHPQQDVEALLKEEGESTAPYVVSFSSAPGFLVVKLPLKCSLLGSGRHDQWGCS